MSEDNFINGILTLHEQKDWLGIVDKYHGCEDRNRLLWVFPSEENLRFLKSELQLLSCDGILSIGCGSGLLEWIITEATGLPTTCVEVDGAWWGCKYSPPTFKPLHFCKLDLHQDEDTKRLIEDHKGAILFCYFNNGQAFQNYMNTFTGNVLIIIGPDEGRGTHTNPRPFNDIKLPWKLHCYQEVRNSKDYIAIYCKN